MPGKSADSKDFIEGTQAAAVQIMLADTLQTYLSSESMKDSSIPIYCAKVTILYIISRQKTNFFAKFQIIVDKSTKII